MLQQLVGKAILYKDEISSDVISLNILVRHSGVLPPETYSNASV